MVLHAAPFRGVAACKQKTALQKVGYTGSLFVNVVMIPSQLKIVLMVCGSTVRIDKGYITQSVAGRFTPQPLNPLCLPTGVKSYNSYGF